MNTTHFKKAVPLYNEFDFLLQNAFDEDNEVDTKPTSSIKLGMFTCLQCLQSTNIMFHCKDR